MNGSLWAVFRLARPPVQRMLAAAVAGVLATGCAIALLAVSGFLLARASQHPDIAALSVAVVAVRGLSLGRGGFRYLERLASHDVAFRALARTRVAIWRKLEALGPAGLPAFRSGDLLTRLVADVDATQDLFVRGLTPVVAAGLAGCGAVIACVALTGPGGLLLAGGLLAGGVVVPAVTLLAVRQAARRVAPVRGEYAASVADLLDGAADLSAFGAADLALARAGRRGRRLSRLAARDAAASGLATGLSVLVAGLTVWGVLLLGVAATSAGTISRVPLAAGTLTALAAFEAVSPLPMAALALSHTRASADRIRGVLDQPPLVAEPSRPRALPSGPVTVSLRSARVRYAADEPDALDGVSLELRPGVVVALTGPNGSGKSTVASVLLRFRELDGGSAVITSAESGESHALADYLADDVRTLISGCPQDPHLFNASVAENLLMARPDATDEELASVVKRVGLGSWVSSLPLGLDTGVGEGGAAVSGGQRQRIALGRALLAGPSVLILDEPTVHVDPAGRRALLADLLSASDGRAVLLITHDPDALEFADEVVVLERGRVTSGRVTSGNSLDTGAAGVPEFGA